jgi:hypothetical protein
VVRDADGEPPTDAGAGNGGGAAQGDPASDDATAIASDAADADAGERGPEADAERPVRRGAVDLRTRDGERVHHDDAYVRYETDAFVVAVDPSFDEATRYPKASLAWVEVRHPRG